MAMLNLGPCSMLAPHYHPRASNYVVAVTGTTNVFFIEENGARLVSNTLNPGQMTIFPQGSLHTMVNTGSSPYAPTRRMFKVIGGFQLGKPFDNSTTKAICRKSRSVDHRAQWLLELTHWMFFKPSFGCGVVGGSFSRDLPLRLTLRRLLQRRNHSLISCSLQAAQTRNSSLHSLTMMRVPTKSRMGCSVYPSISSM